MFDGQIPHIRSISERQFDMIHVDLIDVPNPRKRDEKQFQETMRSIREIGLLKPIILNAIRFEETGRYSLVCGEGRLKIFIMLEKTHIMAEIINVDEGMAYILSHMKRVLSSYKGSDSEFPSLTKFFYLLCFLP